VKSIRDLPEVPGANFLGHAHLFRNDRERFFRSIARTGDMVRGRMLHRTPVFAHSPRLAHEILVEKARSFEKSPGIRLLLHYLAGEGLFTSEGELWKRQRRLMAPLFVPGAIAQHAVRMHEIATRSLTRLHDGEKIDLARETTRIAMGVVGKALFESDTFDEADELGEALTTMLGWTNEAAGQPALVAHIMAMDLLDEIAPRVPALLRDRVLRARAAVEEPFMLKDARSPKMRQAVARLDRKVQDMIDERRAAPGTRDDLLARLLTAKDTDDASFGGMSDRQIRDEAITLFVAGHETTATSLAWCFYLLARHPDIRARVQAEVDSLPEGPIDFARAQKLDLTLRVFKEAMRIYPPVEILARRTLEDVTIGDVHLPARTIVFVNPWIVHRHEATWPDPEVFDPDRFLPENEAKRPKSAWLPFGAGPRVCIGNHFAMLEGPIVLATMMRFARFEVDPNRVIEAEAFATLRPKGGVPAVVKLRRPHAELQAQL
jgi:cytochrome P450